MRKNLPESWAVIMAGGRGVRFWPESTRSKPKQLLRLMGNLTFLEQTVQRLEPVFPPERILIVTASGYVGVIRELLKGKLPAENILGEPAGRDTAPCVALASALIEVRGGGESAGVCFFPSDAVIRDTRAFAEAVSESIFAAEKEKAIVTLGITPTFPSSGYGYIEMGEECLPEAEIPFRRGVRFREKPDLPTAEGYLSSGRFKWNAGIFIAARRTLEEAFRRFAPDLEKFREDLREPLAKGDSGKIAELYESVRKVSIDYAVMEKADNILVGSGRFDWDDAGVWTSLRNQLEPDENNNILRGRTIGIGTSNCIVATDPDHLVATVDMDDVVIVHTRDATLVCKASSAQRVKDLVSLMEKTPGLEAYL